MMVTLVMEKKNSKEVLNTFESLKEGVVFETFEEMRTSIRKWSDKFFMPLVIFTNNTNKKFGKKGRISLKCPHGLNQGSIAKGIQKVQSINFPGCPAIVNAKEQNDGTWLITKASINIWATWSERLSTTLTVISSEQVKMIKNMWVTWLKQMSTTGSFLSYFRRELEEVLKLKISTT